MRLHGQRLTGPSTSRRGTKAGRRTGMGGGGGEGEVGRRHTFMSGGNSPVKDLNSFSVSPISICSEEETATGARRGSSQEQQCGRRIGDWLVERLSSHRLRRASGEGPHPELLQYAKDRATSHGRALPSLEPGAPPHAPFPAPLLDKTANETEDTARISPSPHPSPSAPPLPLRPTPHPSPGARLRRPGTFARQPRGR